MGKIKTKKSGGAVASINDLIFGINASVFREALGEKMPLRQWLREVNKRHHFQLGEDYNRPIQWVQNGGGDCNEWIYSVCAVEKIFRHYASNRISDDRAAAITYLEERRSLVREKGKYIPQFSEEYMKYMAQILPVTRTKIGKDVKVTVDARQFYAALDLYQPFRGWLDCLFEEYHFIEGKEYFVVQGQNQDNEVCLIGVVAATFLACVSPSHFCMDIAEYLRQSKTMLENQGVLLSPKQEKACVIQFQRQIQKVADECSQTEAGYLFEFIHSSIVKHFGKESLHGLNLAQYLFVEELIEACRKCFSDNQYSRVTWDKVGYLTFITYPGIYLAWHPSMKTPQIKTCTLED